MAGNADDLRQAADALDGVDESAVKIYSARAKKNKDSDIMEMMKKETWMNADKAVEIGFADRIYEGSDTAKMDANFRQMRDTKMQALLYPCIT